MFRLCRNNPTHVTLDDSRVACPDCGTTLQTREEYEHNVAELNRMYRMPPRTIESDEASRGRS